MAVYVQESNAGSQVSPFMSYAFKAVQAEKRGEFQKAAEIWSKALFLSGVAVNREWAGTRIEFCANAVHRGWGVVGESEGF
ncbi:TPA: ANR family transcriptional regulator [Citrobacter freundii]|nr:ANR family transcriptional regulator [Escherichia coli]HCG2937274.1 ANR family transcriptional regulator [Escherichia coli]HCG3100382.1 ANR family transcriptional regulator [Escherichia coli]